MIEAKDESYKTNLRINAQAAEATLAFLRQHKFIDRQTQTMFVDLAVYNTNVGFLQLVRSIDCCAGLGWVVLLVGRFFATPESTHTHTHFAEL